MMCDMLCDYDDVSLLAPACDWPAPVLQYGLRSRKQNRQREELSKSWVSSDHQRLDDWPWLGRKRWPMRVLVLFLVTAKAIDELAVIYYDVYVAWLLLRLPYIGFGC